MNRENDTAVDDSELTPYLEGRDGVSEAYRASSKELPPAALDAAILQAARASVHNQSKPLKTPALRNYYSLAASLMLGMMLGAVLFRGSDEVAVSDASSAPPAAPIAEKTSSVSDDVAGATNAPAVAEAASEQQAFAAQARSTAANAEQAPAAAADTELQEIVVTGSRITRREYRDNQQDWLRELARMTEQLQQSSDELTTLREMLEQERAEFSAAYPEVRVDEALRNLREQ